MKYIFDFDHTLYCTEKFVEAAEPYKANGEWLTPRVWDLLDASTFFYDDTIDFLKAQKPKDITILTAWTPTLGDKSFDFQRVKIEKSGVSEYVGEIIIMEGDKGPHVKSIYDGTPTVFIDDRIDHLLSSREHCPEVMVIQMVRDDAGMLPGDPSVPVVSALNEISEVIKL